MANNTEQELKEKVVYLSVDCDFKDLCNVCATRVEKLLGLIEAEATRREQALLDELDAALPRKTERIESFIASKRQSLKERKQS